MFINSSGGQYMAEVLEAVCKKRVINNPKDYALVLDLKNQKLFIPLDRTVKSLQGNRDLMLIRKSMLQNYGVDMGKRNASRSTDPNGECLRRVAGLHLLTTDQSFNCQTRLRGPRANVQLPVRLHLGLQGE